MRETVFPLPLNVHIRKNGMCATLLSDFTYHDGNTLIVVPAGFVSDWNSTPRGLWNTFPPWKYPEAGIVHDFLYRGGSCTRAEADMIHRRILEVLGCPTWKRWAAWSALRAFGASRFGLGTPPRACDEESHGV